MRQTSKNRPLLLFKKITYSRKFIYFSFFIFSFLQCNNSSPNGGLAGLLSFLFGENSDPVFILNFNKVDNGKSNGDSTLLTLGSVIDLAHESVYCVSSDINEPSLLERLKNAKARGLDISVRIDENAKNGIGYLKLRSFLSTSRTTEDITSRKLWFANTGSTMSTGYSFCTIDDNKVYLTSAPFTKEGLYYTNYYSMYIKSPPDGIVSKFKTEAALAAQNGLTGSNKQKLNRRTSFLVNGKEVNVFIDPQEDGYDFIIPRILRADSSIDGVFTKFFVNKTEKKEDGLTYRVEGDIAYNILHSKATTKKAIGSYKATVTPDTAKTEIGYENSIAYLARNKVPTSTFSNQFPITSLNVAILKSKNGDNMAILTDGALDKKFSSRDTFYFILQEASMMNQVEYFVSEMNQRSINLSNIGNSQAPLDVVVSELNYTGGIDASGTQDSKYTYIELYNTQNYIINMSGWKFRCGSNGSFDNEIRIPSGTIIGPKEYFLITDDGDNKVVNAAHIYMNLNVTDDGVPPFALDPLHDQCALYDIMNNQIDVVGESGSPFYSDSRRTGMFDADNLLVRSLERTDFYKPGTVDNLHTNTNPDYSSNFNIGNNYVMHTYGTPGVENSPDGEVPVLETSPARVLKINEISSQASGDSKDNWVEIFNPSENPIDLGATGVYLMRDSGCKLDDWYKVITLKGVIPAKGYYLIIDDDNTALLNIADQNDLDTISNGDGSCYALTMGKAEPPSWDFPNVIDFVNLRGAGGDEAKENGSYVKMDEKGGVSRCPNGWDMNVNGDDFFQRGTTPKSANHCTLLAQGEVVINEIGIGSGNADYVELYNKTTAPVDLSTENLYLEMDSNCSIADSDGDGVADGGFSDNVKLTGVIPANGYYVIAGSDLGGGNQNDLDGITNTWCVLLTRGNVGYIDSKNSSVIDWVSLGGSTTGSTEGGVRTPDPGTGAVSRCPDGLDNNTNNVDFKSKPKTMGSKNNCDTVSLLGVVINEVGLADELDNTGFGTGANDPDDYIELFNTTNSDIDLSSANALLQTDSSCSISAGGITNKIALSGTIRAKGKLVFSRKGNSLGVNPDPDGDGTAQLDIGNIDSSYCVGLTNDSTSMTAYNSSNVVDFIAMTTAGDSLGIASGAVTKGYSAIKCDTITPSILGAYSGAFFANNATYTQTFNADNTNCPVYNLLSATPKSSTSLELKFAYEPDNVEAVELDNFAITNGVTVTNAVLGTDKKTITLTTSTQTSAQAYTVTVENTELLSLGGQQLTVNSLGFTGYTSKAVVIINEVAVNNAAVNGYDFVELKVLSGGTMGSWEVKEITTSSYKFSSSFLVSTGDLVLVHYNSASQTDFVNEDLSSNNMNSSPARSVGTVPNGVNGVWDVYSSSTGLTATDTVVYLYDSSSAIMDAICVSNKDGDAASSGMTAYANLYTAAQWVFPATPVDGTNDVATQNACTLAGSAGNSVMRVSTARSSDDTNTNGDWHTNTQTYGATNSDF